MTKRYDYIYVVVCYSGFWTRSEAGLFKNKEGRLIRNLARQVEFLKKYEYLEDKSLLLICNQRKDDPEVAREIREYIRGENLPKRIDFQLITSPNREMTIGGMWDTYKFIQRNNIWSKYFIVTDDDYIFNHWPERQRELENGYAYLGMFERMIPGKEPYSRIWKNGFKSKPPTSSTAANERSRRLLRTDFGTRWTDGGYYFMKTIMLPRLEAGIGKFNKAPKGEMNCREDYKVHGIVYGEVGFPTSIYNVGHRFKAFQEHCYLHREDGHYKDFAQIEILHRETPPEFFKDEYDPSGWIKLVPGEPMPKVDRPGKKRR